jgi:hypothetical protein
VTLGTGGRTVYILDAGPEGSTGRVATLRRHGVVGTALRGLESPRDLTVDPRGNVSVLEMTDEGPQISVFEARYVASPDAFPYRETIEDFRIEEADDTLVPECIEAITDESVIVHGPLSASSTPQAWGNWQGSPLRVRSLPQTFPLLYFGASASPGGWGVRWTSAVLTRADALPWRPSPRGWPG